MRKRTEQEICDIAADANKTIIAVAIEAVKNTEDEEQRYMILTMIGAALFGAAGAQFQIANLTMDKDEAAKATLAHIGSLLGAYIN